MTSSFHLCTPRAHTVQEEDVETQQVLQNEWQDLLIYLVPGPVVGAGQNGRRGGTYPGAGSSVKEACSEWPLNQPLATPAPHAPHCPPWRKSPPAWLAMTSAECRVETGRREEMALDGSQDSWALACPALPRMSRVTFSNHCPLHKARGAPIRCTHLVYHQEAFGKVIFASQGQGFERFLNQTDFPFLRNFLHVFRNVEICRDWSPLGWRLWRDPGQSHLKVTVSLRWTKVCLSLLHPRTPIPWPWGAEPCHPEHVSPKGGKSGTRQTRGIAWG